MVIPEVLLPYSNSSHDHSSPYASRVTAEFLSALQYNAHQVHTYLVAYAGYSSDFEQIALDRLTQLLIKAEQLHSLGLSEKDSDRFTSAADAYYEFLVSARSMCQRVWAQFDDVFIYTGLAIIAAVPVSLVGFLVAKSLQFWKDRGVLKLMQAHLRGEAGWVDVVSVLVMVCLWLAPVSNSFVVYEQDVTVFLLQTLLVCLVLVRVRLAWQRLPRHSTESSVLPLLVKVSWRIVGAMVCVRLSRLFYFCRDQQDTCEQTNMILPLSSAYETQGWLAVVRYLITCISFITVTMLAASYCSERSNSWLTVKYIAPVSSVCVCVYWGLSLIVTGSLSSWFHVLLPQSVYAASLCMIVMSVWTKRQESKELNTSSLLHLGFSSLKVVLLSVWIPLCMLLNDAICLAACLFMVQLFLTAQALERLPQG